MTLTDVIIKEIESYGFKVDCRVVGDTFVAVAVGDGGNFEATGDSEYLCAVDLAQAVGIDLEG